jgi:hypothetical protein
MCTFANDASSESCDMCHLPRNALRAEAGTPADPGKAGAAVKAAVDVKAGGAGADSEGWGKAPPLSGAARAPPPGLTAGEARGKMPPGLMADPAAAATMKRPFELAAARSAFVCNICDTDCHSSANFDAHLRSRTHLDAELGAPAAVRPPRSAGQPANLPPMFCPVCSVRFATRLELDVHLVGHQDQMAAEWQQGLGLFPQSARQF